MYRLIRFDDVNLEYVNQVDQVGSGPTPVSVMPLPDGGALDLYGGATKHPGAVERTKTVRLLARTKADLENQFFQLLALRGRRGRLYRRTSQGVEHWMFARCVEVAAERSYEQARFGLVQDVELRFLCLESTWRGTHRGSWTLDSGYKLNSGLTLDSGTRQALNASPTSFTINLGAAGDPGRAPVRSMIITVLPGNAAMSSVTIQRTSGEKLVYTGSIPAGAHLSIYTGTLQVICPGALEAYNNLAFAPAADMAAWFTLQPGANQITVSYTGGGTGRSIQFTYDEAWY